MMNILNNFYVTMATKIAETGDMYYYLKNYDEYLRLIFSNWFTGASYVFCMLVFIAAMATPIVMALNYKKIYNFVYNTVEYFETR